MPHWRIAAGQQLRRRGWEDEIVVYNDLSGDTHLLSAPAWLLLAALQSACANAAALAERLELDPDDLPDLERMLSSLHQLGLVEQASPQ